MENKRKMNKQEAGRLGAEQTHKERYEIIVQLSAYVDKAYQNYLMNWKTEYLRKLLSAYKK